MRVLDPLPGARLSWVPSLLPPLLVILSLLSACGLNRRVAVEVGSQSPQPVPIEGKRLVVDLNEKAPNLVIEQDIATKIMRGLAQRGYEQAANADEADYVLQFAYGLQNGQENLQSDGSQQQSIRETNGGEEATYNGRLVIHLFVRSDLSRPVWVGEAVSSGNGAALRVVMDYLIIASLNHLGQGLSHPVSYTFRDTDRIWGGHRPDLFDSTNP